MSWMGESFLKRGFHLGSFGGFPFVRREGVYLSNLWGKGIVEIDLVVIGSGRGNMVSGFFREYRSKRGIF